MSVLLHYANITNRVSFLSIDWYVNSNCGFSLSETWHMMRALKCLELQKDANALIDQVKKLSELLFGFHGSLSAEDHSLFVYLVWWSLSECASKLQVMHSRIPQRAIIEIIWSVDPDIADIPKTAEEKVIVV